MSSGLLSASVGKWKGAMTVCLRPKVHGTVNGFRAHRQLDQGSKLSNNYTRLGAISPPVGAENPRIVGCWQVAGALERKERKGASSTGDVSEGPEIMQTPLL